MTVALDDGVTFGVVGSVLKVNATTFDAEGTVAQVEFFADDVSFQTDTGDPFVGGFLPDVAGFVSITAVATDSVGNQATSDPIVVEILTVDPSSILDPINNTEDFVSTAYADFIFRDPSAREIRKVTDAQDTGDYFAKENLILELLDTLEGNAVFDAFGSYRAVWGFWPTPDEFSAALDGGVVSAQNGVDDHPSSIFTDAPTQIADGNSQAGSINFPGDIDVFGFTVKDDGSSVVLETSGRTDVKFDIWEDTNTGLFFTVLGFVASDDDSGPDNNAFLSLILNSGTYRIAVSGDTNADTGSYRVGVNANLARTTSVTLDNNLAAELVRGQLESSDFITKYGDLSTSGADASLSSRLKSSERHYEFFYDESPSDSQIRQGALRIAATDHTTFIAAIGSETQISGQDYIFGSPDMSFRKLAAYAILGLWKVEPLDSEIAVVLNTALSDDNINRLKLASGLSDIDDRVAIINHLINHPNYMTRFMTTPIGKRVALGGSWFTSDWFGAYYEGRYPWVYNADKEWLYSVSRKESDMWMYQVELGWYWTNPDVFPYLYSENEEGWLYFGGRLNGFEWYYSFQTEEWFSVESTE